MDDDRVRWDARHEDSSMPDPAAPDALVEADLVDAVPTVGRVVDVACGLGPVCRWAVRRGLDVVALDVSGVAIERLAGTPEAATGHLDARRVDLDDGLPGDLDAAELVVCQRFRDPGVIASLPALVSPGGLLVVTVLSRVGAPQPGPFHAPAGELLRLLPVDEPGWDLLHRREADGSSSLVLRRTEGELTRCR